MERLAAPAVTAREGAGGQLTGGRPPARAVAKILLTIDSLQIGGAERHLVDLATTLHDRGVRVEVACSAAGPLATDLRECGIPLHVLMPTCVKRRTSARHARELRRVVMQQRPDVVHAHLYASAAAAALATVGTGIPLVVTEQTEAPWRSLRARLVSRFVYRRAHAVIAVSEAIREGLLTRYRVTEEKVRVVRNSVIPMPSGTRNGRNGRTVGTIARLHPEKGLAFLLDAAPKIASAVPDVRFMLVGDGPLREELEAHARRVGVAARVDFMGARDDARQLIPGFDVLALPSISEGTPLTIVEAMLAGVPVVATAVGGVPEQVEDHETGLLVPPRDAKALAVAVVQTLTDQALARRIAEAARARAETEFSHKKVIAQIAAVYAAAAPALAGQPRPPGRQGHPRTNQIAVGARDGDCAAPVGE